MAKADITTRSGTKVNIEGTPEEVAKVLGLIEGSKTNRTSTKKKSSSSSNKKKKIGLTDHIRQLKDEGFFEERRELGDIKDKLEERAVIYPVTTISPVLTRMVRAGELGRLKDNGQWVYVQR